MADNSAIRIALIQGSVRPDNYTSKALALVVDEIITLGLTPDLIDPTGLDLPLPGTGAETPEAVKIQQTIGEAAGIVLATPEYHGSFSSVMKLVIENLGFPSELSGKPVALLGVAAGRIGAIKALEHLRSVCSHVGAIVLPGPVSVAGVQDIFDDDGTCTDAAVEKAVRGIAAHLNDYIHQSICPDVALEASVRGEAV